MTLAAPTNETATLNMAALDSSSGWISTASDLARLFESLARTAKMSTASSSGSAEAATQTGSSNSGGTTAQILRPETVRAMLARPSYGDKYAAGTGLPASSKQSNSASSQVPLKAWYGLGVVVEDSGETF